MQLEIPLVRHFMTPEPVILDGGLSLADAATRMFQVHARHLPVFVGGHLVGILSDRDIAQLSAVKGINPDKYTAEQAATPNPYVCTPDTPLEQAAQVLIDHKFGAALVMERGRLVGILTVIDVMQALVAVLHRDAAKAVDPAHDWRTARVGSTAA
ncbi:MAG: CBS domain-containing protein [Myxococcales bacterium]|nr:CBS domain-containing protein [Myxococcales bacterium]